MLALELDQLMRTLKTSRPHNECPKRVILHGLIMTILEIMEVCYEGQRLHEI